MSNSYEFYESYAHFFCFCFGTLRLSHCQNGKTTAIRRTAFTETSVSRKHEGIVKGTLETPRTSEYYCDEGFKGGFLIGPL